jgi:hypothetical protein
LFSIDVVIEKFVIDVPVTVSLHFFLTEGLAL